MKKTIILLAMLISLQAVSQEESIRYKAYSVQQSFWSASSKSYITVNGWKKCNFTLALSGGTFTINDPLRSRFKVTSDSDKNVEEDYTSLSWDAIDNKGKKCIVQMVFIKIGDGSVVFQTLYNNMLWEYKVEKETSGSSSSGSGGGMDDY